MAAIPDQLREEVVASKSVSALGILSKGMPLYQPGGLAERSAILSSLEPPMEATTVSSAISTLRKWLRWKRRAEELKVGLPDPKILVRGLSKLVKRILQGIPDLSFRLSLVRNILMIDTVPSHESVSRCPEHLLASWTSNEEERAASSRSAEVEEAGRSAEGGQSRAERWITSRASRRRKEEVPFLSHRRRLPEGQRMSVASRKR
jgi:hypothetical protein